MLHAPRLVSPLQHAINAINTAGMVLTIGAIALSPIGTIAALALAFA